MQNLVILLVDNDPNMATYIEKELRRYYKGIVVNQVFNQDQLFKAISSKDFDVVITEYELGWIDGLTVLDYVKELDSYCPVILFTTKMSYQAFDEGIKRGLDDYVFKFPYASQRLVTSIRICLQNAKNLKEAKEAIMRYETLFNSVPIALVLFSETEGIMEFNNAFAELFDFKDLTQIKNRKIEDFFVNKEDFEKIKKLIGSTNERKYRSELMRSNNSSFWAEIHCDIMERDARGNNKFIFSILDISENIKIEELKRKAFMQIEEIIEKDALIIDNLRNQLSVIGVLAELPHDEYKEKIMRKIDEMDKALSKMNEHIAISNKIRHFIKKYFV